MFAVFGAKLHPVRLAQMVLQQLGNRPVKQDSYIRHKLLQSIKVRNIGCENS